MPSRNRRIHRAGRLPDGRCYDTPLICSRIRTKINFLALPRLFCGYRSVPLPLICAFPFGERGNIMVRNLCIGLFVIAVAIESAAQTKWYRFSKAFIATHYPTGGAIGTLEANGSSPAKNVHTISCSGNDGELHIGVDGSAVVLQGTSGGPISVRQTDLRSLGLWLSPLMFLQRQTDRSNRSQEARFGLPDTFECGTRGTTPDRYTPAIRTTYLRFILYGDCVPEVLTSHLSETGSSP